MTLQQLNYIIAVDTYRNFRAAADKCFVTQPTLSMMILSLEKELGVKIFDRTKKPVIPTDIGKAIIEQARAILSETRIINEIIDEGKNSIEGELRLGIIPTIAPYLLPLFLKNFMDKYPGVRIKLAELTTETIIDRLKKNILDAGILATPLNDSSINEHPLFYEEFVVYLSKNEPAYKKKYILAEDINPDHLWLLEEGHCLRSQVLNICELRKRDHHGSSLEYQAGNVDTLRKMVDINFGITILPELAVRDLNKKQIQNIRYFKPPGPIRETSIVTHRSFVKKKYIQVLREEILKNIPDKMKTKRSREVIFINNE